MDLSSWSSLYNQQHIPSSAPRSWGEAVAVAFSFKTYVDSELKKWTRAVYLWGERTLLHRSLNEGLVADEPLQHHHQAPRPLAERAVGVLLQEGEELRSDLGQHGGHVVPRQRVAVVQVHHCVLQVAERGQRGTETSDNDDDMKTSQALIISTAYMSWKRNC